MATPAAPDGSQTPPSSTEEEDQRQRSIKKHKRDGSCADHEAPSAMQGDEGPSSPARPPASFADVLTGQHHTLTIYTGDGEDDITDDLGMADVIQAPLDAVDPETCPIVELSWEEYRELWKPWRRALILKVLGRNIHFRILESCIRRMWQLDLGCELIDMAKGFIIAHFYSQQDYLKVLQDGPWMVMGSYLTVSKWRPNFTPNDPICSTTLVWVRVPEIPIEMFKETVLLQMGNKIGKAIKVDTTSVDVVRGNFARICVEIDLNKPLKPNVMILGRVLTVEYEGLPKICFHCGHNGHFAATCPQLAPPAAPASADPAPGHADATVNPALDRTSPFGPWMMPAHVRRKLQQQQQRMNRKAPISEANRRLNARLDKDRTPGRNASNGQARASFGGADPKPT